MLYENGRGIILPDLAESLKIGVTVPCLKVFAQLFRPMSPVFSEMWLDGVGGSSSRVPAPEVHSGRFGCEAPLLKWRSSA